MIGDGGNLNRNPDKAKTATVNLDVGTVYFQWRARKAENLDDHPRVRQHSDRVEQEILEVVKKTNILEIMPTVGFVIERNKDKNTAYVSTGERAEVVHITAELIDKRFGENSDSDPRTLSSTFDETIHHELIHLFDKYKSENFEVYARHANKVEEIKEEEIQEFDKVGKRLETQKAVALKDIKKMVTIFMHKIRAEGLARLYDKSMERHFEEGKYSGDNKKERFETMYNKANTRARNIKENLQRNKDGEVFLPGLEKLVRTDNPEEIEKLTSIISPGGDFAYQIGAHVIYTLEYFQNENPFDSTMPAERIVNLSTFQMVFKYEEVMLKHDMQPVITVNSGKGVLDFKIMINVLAEAFNEVVDVEK